MAAHAQPHNRHLGYLGVEHHAIGADLRSRSLDAGQGFGRVPLGHGKGEVRKAIGAGILDDHVHHDVVIGDWAEELSCQTGSVWYA